MGFNGTKLIRLGVVYSFTVLVVESDYYNGLKLRGSDGRITAAVYYNGL